MAGFVVAIDGPAGSGKTTIGQMIARRLEATFLDTGVLYRALTLQALTQGVDLQNVDRLEDMAEGLNVRIGPLGRDPEIVWLHGQDVTEAIRSPKVEAAVSEVAAIPRVRTALIAPQRAAAGPGRAVVVGRDIGTVIFPNAPLKVFLDASLTDRATRRVAQSGGNFVDVLEDLDRRDQADRSRKVAPFQIAPDAWYILNAEPSTPAEITETIVSVVKYKEDTMKEAV